MELWSVGSEGDWVEDRGWMIEDRLRTNAIFYLQSSIIDPIRLYRAG